MMVMMMDSLSAESLA
jgi:hypothetical protein